MFPLNLKAAHTLWNLLEEKERTKEDYIHLYDLLLRMENDEERNKLIAGTIHRTEMLDQILMQTLSFFRGFSTVHTRSFTHPSNVKFLNQTASQLRFLDTSCFWPSCTRQFMTYEMDLQQTGAIVPVVSYSSLRALDNHTRHLFRLPRDLQWTLELLQEEIERGNIHMIFPSDELTLCRPSYATDAMMPIYATRFMTKQMPLLEPILVSVNRSHLYPDEYPLYSETPSSTLGGYNEIKKTFWSEMNIQRRIIQVVPPRGRNRDHYHTHYEGFVDEKVQGILRNERAQYSRTRNLDYKHMVTERPGYYGFLLDVRRAGYAPAEEG